MTEPTHDLIAAKAARMRELLRYTGSDANGATDADPVAVDDADDDPGERPWGGNWNN